MVQFGKIHFFSVARLNLRGTLQHLLHGIGCRAAGSEPFFYMPLFQSSAEIDRKERDWHHPQERERHPPVIDQHTGGNHGRGDQRAVHGGIKVGKRLFQCLRICHDGGGKVGQIPFSEERKRKPAQYLGYPDASVGTLSIGRVV